MAAAASLPANRALAAQLFPQSEATVLAGAPWFSLAVYQKIPQWSRADWYAAICARFSVRWNLEWPSDTAIPPIARIADFIKGLQVDPVTGQSSTRIGAGRDDAFLHDQGGWPGTIAQTKWEDLSRISKVFITGGIGGFDSLNRHMPLVQVDMMAGDREIVAAFKAWLKTQRSSPLRSAMTAADMNSWTACQVIPYLDLKLYELASGTKLRGVDIQRALLPNADDPKKTIEQSTRPYADRLRSVEFRVRLLAHFGSKP